MPPVQVMSARAVAVREFVEPYESACATGAEPSLDEFLPPAGHPDYAAVLCELICIELERAIGAGRPRSLDEYRARFPALTAGPVWWREVVGHDFRTRAEAGEMPDPGQYLARYGVEVGPAAGGSRDRPPPTEVAGRPEPPQDRTMVVQVAAAAVPPIDPGGESSSWGPLLAAPPTTPRPSGRLSHRATVSAPPSARGVTRMPVAGTDFVGFHLVSEIGKGAFSRVFLARQSDLADRFVVLKVATDHFGESQTLAQLQHTNIVPIYSRHPAGPYQAVCMPFLGATTFGDVLATIRSSNQLPQSGRQLLSTRRAQSTVADFPTVLTPSAGSDAEGAGATPPPPSDPKADAPAGDGRVALPTPAWLDRLARMSFVDAVLVLFGRLADGLAHAHSRGILHRDLKPANVLLTDDGEPMLLDFNLSEDANAAASGEAAGIGGTLPYMAPEHLRAFRGEAVPVDARSDVYSLGVVLFEMLTARHPFPIRTGSLRTMLPAMLQDRAEAPRLRPVNPAISPAVESIVRTCLAVDPAHRYPTAEALRADIQRHLDDLPLRVAPNPSVTERARKWRRRNPRAVPFVLLLLVTGLLVGAVGLFAREQDRVRVQRDERMRLEAVAAAEEFESREFEVNSRLNALPVPPDQLGPGIAFCENTLSRLGTFADAGWTMAAESSRLGDRERTRAAATAGEFLLVLAQGLVAAADAAGDDGRPLLTRALRLNESAERTFPDGSLPRQLFTQRADLLSRLGDEAGARRAAAAAARTPLRDAWDRYTLARREETRGRVREAIRLLADATRESPNHFWSWFLLGHCHHLVGETTEAIRCYSCCLAVRPDYDPPYLQRGIAYLTERKFAEARADLDRVVAGSPDHAEAYLNRAIARDGLGDADGAIADLDRVVGLGDRHARALFLRAAVREKRGDAAGAKRDRELGLKREPIDPESWVVRGLYKAGHGDPDGALADYEKALALDPRSLAALQNSAVVLTDNLARPADAVRSLDRALKIDPDYLPALRGRAVLLARLGRREAAHADIAAALRRDPSATTRYYAACVYALTAGRGAEDRAVAVNHVRTAIAGGFGLEHIEQDDDLKGVRDVPEFRRLLTAVRALRNVPEVGK